MDVHELQARIRAGDYDRFVVHVGGRRLVVARPRYRRRAPDNDDDYSYIRGDHGLSNKRARVVPVTDAAINRGLRKVTHAKQQLLQTECAVCLKDFGADDELRAMPCDHAFHEQCIVPWLRRNAVCPLCRSPLLPPGPAQEQEDPTAPDMPAPEDTA